jgi:hypothetical protein
MLTQENCRGPFDVADTAMASRTRIGEQLRGRSARIDVPLRGGRRSRNSRRYRSQPWY